jgi:bifunctional UDP-N-acetylglucosamine pyrophosphorylase/glucosamine-1-phosphate N-acetyltransferase
MRSGTPKVLHQIYGKPMLQYVLDVIAPLKPKITVVVTGEKQFSSFKDLSYSGEVVFALQKERKGTAHALLKASKYLKAFKGTVLVMNGDTPLLRSETLQKFLRLHGKKAHDISLASFIAENPGAYGRVLRSTEGRPVKIVERSDASAKDISIREVNSGVYAIKSPALPLLKDIRLNRKKREYYLTDIVELASKRGVSVGAFCQGDESEFLGVNTREELSLAHEAIRERILEKWLSRGITFIDPFSVYIEPDVTIGSDTTIYPNVYLQGTTKIGKTCTVYPNVRIVDSVIKSKSIIKDTTLIEESVVGPGASVGPFAHLRPGSRIGKSSKIGNFVEVKASTIGVGTKAMHLTYIGDAEVGSNVNIGAGTITCNYDGVKKYKTKIGNGVFVGSDTQLVAPVKIGEGSYIGAGTTVTKDVPPGHLATSRTRQRSIEWKPRKKK